MQNWSLFFSILLTCKSFGKKFFLGALFSKYFHGFETSVTLCVFLIHRQKRNQTNFEVIDYTNEYFLELAETA